MFRDDMEQYQELAEELLEFFSLEEILEMNDLEESDVIALLISNGLVDTYKDYTPSSDIT